MAGKANNPLLEQQQALDSFFESLMRDVDAYAENEVETQAGPVVQDAVEATESVPVPAPRPTLVRSSKPVVVETRSTTLFETLPPVAPPAVEAEPTIEEPAPTPVEDAPAPPVAEETPVETAPSVTEPEPQDPAWLGQDLQAMLFKVAGLTLAVPLVDLNGVVEWDEEAITAMPGHADFYLGLMTHLNRQIPVVDTARLVLPENKRVALAGEDPRQRVTRVVLINDSRYGLACDEVNEVITLKADAVRWRSQRTQRRWLAGTVIEHMCALVDATAFAELLANRAPVDAFRE